LLISEQFKKQYLNYLKSYLPEEITQGLSFENSVSENFDDLIHLSHLEVCQNRINGLNLTCESKDLSERMLKLANGDEFIAGARFKNLDIRFPFIEINSSLNMTVAVMSEISHIVRSEFKNIRPLGIKFKDKPNKHLNLEKWSHVVFGQINRQYYSQINTEIIFSLTQSLDWHQQYVAEYQERLKEKNELNGFVRIGQLDEFQESAADQALLVARDEQGFCGVFAGTSSPIYGLPAVYMIESYLSKRWTGKKIAPLAHSIFLNKMANRFGYVWGTIYDQNLSSLNTALRIGRRIIETEYFYRFDDGKS